MDAAKFIQITELVIDKLEGGYFHKQMFSDGRLKYNPAYDTSGETILGIDRKNGIQLAKYPEWNLLWSLIDQSGARSKWKWNYKGGDLYPRLRNLVATLMYKWYSELALKYLTQKSRNAVALDPRLQIHFSYASWNGEGWFKRFAAVTNQDTANGKPIEAIAANALKTRTGSTNSLIKQSGAKIAKMFGEVILNKVTGGPASLGRGAAGIGIALVLFFILTQIKL